MSKKMLIDATDPVETRVVVLSRNRVEELDYESTGKNQLKGNIYLAKVTRVEPSLQAAFVDYGGNRHGFLPFAEIHPDYYRIPIADREALLAEEAALKAEEDALADRQMEREQRSDGGEAHYREPRQDDNGNGGAQDHQGEAESESDQHRQEEADEASAEESRAQALEAAPGESLSQPISDEILPDAQPEVQEASEQQNASEGESPAPESNGEAGEGQESRRGHRVQTLEVVETEQAVDTVGGGDEMEDVARRRARLLRRYKIQEVVKRGQVMLVQVAKEERGNKGAALTTYLSLAGRYCVLMPNTARGGGISRKIGSSSDRRRLKEVLSDLEIPDGMAVIVRTAGSERSKAEIKRDYEYLVRLWNEIRENTLSASAPALIYEEGNLIKRAIRDLYTSDTEEILVEGEDAYKAAKAFMKSLMPSHAKKVQLYKDEANPLFARFQIEQQLSAMYENTVQLKSGGYIVLNPTEALVAIDVNSGRATRERHIEETALKTNLEAADEVARQLRLRDLAGLIVIDFIDMEDNRHNREVERRLKEAMKSDRARIQLGRISPFGLLELSRQRLRPSLVESSTMTCPHCSGTGRIYSPNTVAVQALRALGEEGLKRPGGEVVLRLPQRVALFLLNSKRDRLSEVEKQFAFSVRIEMDEHLHGIEFKLERPGQGREAGRDAGREAGREAAREREPRREGRREERSDEGRRDERREEGRREGRDEPRGEERRERRERRDWRERRDERRPPSEFPPPAPNDENQIEPAAQQEGARAPEAADEPFGGAGDESQRKRRRRGKRGGRRRGRRGEGFDGGRGGDQPMNEASNGEDEAPQEEMFAADAPHEAEHEPERPQAQETAVENGDGSEEPPQHREPRHHEPRHHEPRHHEPRHHEAEQRQEPEARPASAPASEPESPPNFDVISELDPNQPRRRGWWKRVTGQ